VVGNYDQDTIGAKFAEGEEITVPDGQYLAMGPIFPIEIKTKKKW
jgi:signal peptidase I